MKRIYYWLAGAAALVVAAVVARRPLAALRDQFADQLDTLPLYLSGHLLVSLAGLAAGLAIGLPLGVFASRHKKLSEKLVGVFEVIQTVPTLALLALMVPLLAGEIGFLPAFIALTLYAVYPILQSTVKGLHEVSKAEKEAALGMGMTGWQMLCKVEMPLARPSILSGVRISTVLVVGTATLVTPVGGVSLGNYIFGGLESLNHRATVFGCVVAALVAILLAQLVRLIDLALDPRQSRRRLLGLAAAAGVLLVLAVGLYRPVVRAMTPRGDQVVVASGSFSEQQVLSAALGQELEQAGFRPERHQAMSEGIQFQALFRSQIDVMVNYTGNVYTLLMHRQDFKGVDVTAEVSRYLLEQHGVVCLGSLGFENAYAVAAPEARAKELKGSLANLGAYAAAHRKRTGRPLRIGGDNQFFDRPEWRRLKELYRVSDESVETTAMAPTLMYGAARDGQVDLIVAYTTDGRLPAYKMSLLKDPEKALPPYEAILLLSPEAAQRPRLRAALEKLVGKIDLKAMQQATFQVDVEKRPPRAAAEELLAGIAGKS
jgi:osmoprotectant transport system permease protein